MPDSELKKPPSSSCEGKNIHKARKSFPKAKKTVSSAKPNEPNISVHEFQKVILAKMKQTHMSPVQGSSMRSPTAKSEATPQSETIKEAVATGKMEDSVSVKSCKSSDEKKADTAVFDGVNQPPTPASTPLKEDVEALGSVEAAMAALHGEPLDELVNNEADTDIQVVTSRNSEPKSQSQLITKEVIVSPKAHIQKTNNKASNENPPACSDPTPGVIPDLKRKEASQTTQDVAPSTKASKRSRASRELESLRIDEGAIKILDEMKDKARRRSTRPCMGSGYASQDMSSINSSPRKRPDQKEDSDSEKKKKKRNSLPTAKRANNQKDALENWEAIPILNSKKKLLYTPRPYPVHLDGPQEPEKFFSSESDVGDTPVPKKKKRIDLILPDHGVDEFKEILLTYKERFLHVVISPVSTTLHNSFNIRVLKELTSLLRKLKTDSKTLVVLITSAGSDFCTGIDLPSIIHNNDDSLRLNVITETVSCIRDFFLELANCEKYLIGGLNGRVIGIGVAMLPYFDVTYAADKTVFHLPYAALRQSTEGAVGYACKVTSKGMQACSLMLSEGSKLTADQAQQMGLISSVLGLASFNEALMPRVMAIVSQASEALLISKKCIQHSTWSCLSSILELECKQLLSDWSSAEFVIQAEKFLDHDFMA